MSDLPTRTFMETLAAAQDDAFRRDPARNSLGAEIAKAVRATLADLDAAVQRAERAEDAVEAFQSASGLCVPAEERGGDPGGVRPHHVERHIAAVEAERDTLLAAARDVNADLRHMFGWEIVGDNPAAEVRWVAQHVVKQIARVTQERDAALSRVAALEAAVAPMMRSWEGNEHVPFYGNGTAAQGLRDALSGSTSALEARVAAAVEAERECKPPAPDALAAIDAARKGGA